MLFHGERSMMQSSITPKFFLKIEKSPVGKIPVRPPQVQAAMTYAFTMMTSMQNRPQPPADSSRSACPNIWPLFPLRK